MEIIRFCSFFVMHVRCWDNIYRSVTYDNIIALKLSVLRWLSRFHKRNCKKYCSFIKLITLARTQTHYFMRRTTILLLKYAVSNVHSWSQHFNCTGKQKTWNNVNLESSHKPIISSRNGCAWLVWPTHLATFADETILLVRVCFFHSLTIRAYVLYVKYLYV